MTFKIKLLYRASRDGWRVSDFHKFCDDQGPTLTLGISSKNRIFGAFTSITWTTPEQIRVGDSTIYPTNYILDKTATLFSVDSKVKFNNEGNGLAIAQRQQNGPDFGKLYETNDG